MQIIDKLDPVDRSVWAAEISTLATLKDRRVNICRDELGLPLAVGKKVLLEVACGAAVPSHLANNAFVLALSQAARFMRWAAVSALPEVFAAQRDAEVARSVCVEFPLAGSRKYVFSCMGRLCPQTGLSETPVFALRRYQDFERFAGLAPHLPTLESSSGLTS